MNEYEYCLNLKQLQLALAKLRINIPFDINKVSKQRFNENWALIVLMHKHLDGSELKKMTEEKVGSPTPKRPAEHHLPEKQLFEEEKEKVL